VVKELEVRDLSGGLLDGFANLGVYRNRELIFK
jgi:hypothetical protein